MEKEGISKISKSLYFFLFLDIATIVLLATTYFDLCGAPDFSEYIISLSVIFIFYLFWKPLPFLVLFTNLLLTNGIFPVYLLASLLIISFVLKNKLKTIFQGFLFLVTIIYLIDGYTIFTRIMTRGLDCWGPNIMRGEFYVFCSILTTLTITRFTTPLLNKVKKRPGIKLSIALIFLALISLYFAFTNFVLTMSKYPVEGLVY